MGFPWAGPEITATSGWMPESTFLQGPQWPQGRRSTGAVHSMAPHKSRARVCLPEPAGPERM